MKIKKLWLWLFLLPASLLFLYIYAVPLSVLLGSSFSHWVVASPPKFAGLANYIELFTQDNQFKRALLNTVVWMILQGTLHVALGVFTALLLARQKFYWKFTRTVYMFPNIISSAALGMMFVMLLNPSFGVVNKLLQQWGIKNPPNWFMDSGTAFASVTMTWLLFAATVTILVMAEMTSLDKNLLEAATIDGASEFQKNRYIIIPLMKNIIGTTTILATTSMLQKLDILMMTTKGGPGDTTLNLPLYVYNTAFVSNKFGLANAVGVVMIGLGLVFVLLIQRLYGMHKREI